jgi:4-diphosphocytidyl-2-C-methyl-D-erythritol kinase
VQIFLSSQDDAQPDFPLGEDNLIARAIRLFLSELAVKADRLKVVVTVDKAIPIGAGMAGGSANAAAALLAVNDYFGNTMDSTALAQLAGQLGADVPFCLAGGLRNGSGRGDRLSEDLSDNVPDLHLVIAKPTHLTIATPWAYKSWDQGTDLLALSEKLKDRGIEEAPADFAVHYLKENNVKEAVKAFGNDFEQVIFPHYQQLKDIKQTFLKQGAMSCHMTGSGPTIYAVAESEAAAEDLKLRFKSEYCKSEGIVCATKYDPIGLWTSRTIRGGARVVKREE